MPISRDQIVENLTSTGLLTAAEGSAFAPNALTGAN